MVLFIAVVNCTIICNILVKSFTKCVFICNVACVIYISKFTNALSPHVGLCHKFYVHICWYINPI